MNTMVLVISAITFVSVPTKTKENARTFHSVWLFPNVDDHFSVIVVRKSDIFIEFNTNFTQLNTYS